MKIDLANFEKVIELKVKKIAKAEDPAHDYLHFQRVVKSAKYICQQEKGQMEIVMPAAWLHDFIIIPKDDPRRKQASKLSAQAAIEFLKSIQYPGIYFEEIGHAIEAHSFSANIPAQTKEAKIVQDADRLDGIGAIGIARCFATAGVLKRPFYSEVDPFCESRPSNDSIYTIDHFYAKLLKISDSLQTASGKKLGESRTLFLKNYIDQLKEEL